MSTGRVRLLVDINIQEGKFAEVESLARQMVAVSESEPGTLGYHFLLSEDRTRCRLVEMRTQGRAFVHGRSPVAALCGAISTRPAGRQFATHNSVVCQISEIFLSLI